MEELATTRQKDGTTNCATSFTDTTFTSDFSPQHLESRYDVDCIQDI